MRQARWVYDPGPDGEHGTADDGPVQVPEQDLDLLLIDRRRLRAWVAALERAGRFVAPGR